MKTISSNNQKVSNGNQDVTETQREPPAAVQVHGSAAAGLQIRPTWRILPGMRLQPSSPQAQRDYWNTIAVAYQAKTTISVDDFHYGPLLPGDRELELIPRELAGLRTLELGCGAGQNSVYLASRGAGCTAVDVSEAQIAAGEKLAKEHGVTIDFRISALEELDPEALDSFDLVHSVFALPFVSEPAQTIRRAAACLSEDGVFLLSTVHPLFPCEWLEIDGEGDGLFVQDYFTPPVELEQGVDGAMITSRTYPVSTICGWLHEAGLAIVRLLEPRPLPLDEMDEEQVRRRVPYYSPAWRELLPKTRHVPVALVLKCARIRGSMHDTTAQEKRAPRQQIAKQSVDSPVPKRYRQESLASHGHIALGVRQGESSCSTEIVTEAGSHGKIWAISRPGGRTSGQGHPFSPIACCSTPGGT